MAGKAKLTVTIYCRWSDDTYPEGQTCAFCGEIAWLLPRELLMGVRQDDMRGTGVFCCVSCFDESEREFTA